MAKMDRYANGQLRTDVHKAQNLKNHMRLNIHSDFKMAHFIFPFGVVHFEVIDLNLEMAYFERDNKMGHFKI